MSKNKSEKKKMHLVHERKVNKKPPIGMYQKTRNKNLIRERKRSWKTTKLGKKIKQRANKYGD